jgi:hypothetical protein
MLAGRLNLFPVSDATVETDGNLTEVILVLIECCSRFLTSSSNGHHAGPSPNYARNGACGLSSSRSESPFDGLSA